MVFQDYELVTPLQWKSPLSCLVHHLPCLEVWGSVWGVQWEFQMWTEWHLKLKNTMNENEVLKDITNVMLDSSQGTCYKRQDFIPL